MMSWMSGSRRMLQGRRAGGAEGRARRIKEGGGIGGGVTWSDGKSKWRELLSVEGIKIAPVSAC